MTVPTTPGPTTQAPAAELPFAPAPIEELLRLLSKAVRAHQLYLPNNPVYKGAIEAVRAAFPAIWQHTTELPLRFAETEIKWFGHPVLTESTKSADSLPWTFFKDGIREITLSPGFEQEELGKLFDILQRVRKASPEEDDLLTMLWESDFTHLRYRYVDLGAEAAVSLTEGAGGGAGAGGSGDAMSAEAISAAAREESDKATSAIVNPQDFDATLYFLEEKELDYLRGEIDREYKSDLRQNVIGILFDIFEAQTSPDIRVEVTEHIEHLMLMLLAAGQFRGVAYLLSETRAVAKRVTLSPEQQERIAKLPERLSAAEPLGQLLQGLDESADLPPAAELSALFEQLHPVALGTVLAWLPRLQNAKIRALVEQAADRLGSANTAELVRLIASSDRAVAAEAVRRAAAMKTPAAVAPMARLLAETKDAGLRLAIVQALTDIGSAGALQALEHSIDDPDRDVRVTAVRTLGAKAYRGVFTRVDAAVKSKDMRSADLTEKMAFFEAYGAMCGEGGIPYLDGILNGKSMFGKREDPELRACAAIALGRIATAKARESLQRASSEKDVVVRNAVNRALRGGAGGTA